MKIFLSLILFSSILFSHSYNIVEMLGPDEDRAYLLIKDNHELASKEENLDELSGIKSKLAQLNREKRETLVLVESMWMYGRAFTKAHIEDAIRETLTILAPKVKGTLRAESRTFQNHRNGVAYLDIPLPIEIASIMRNEYIHGESVDPRLPILKLSRLLENKSAKKIKVSIQQLWTVVDQAKKHIEEIYRFGEETEAFDVSPEFWSVVEELARHATNFELLLNSIINKDDLVAKVVLTKKNVERHLSEVQRASLGTLIHLDIDNMKAHAWVQDIATLRKILDPNAPKTVIVASGGMHLDLLQQALLGLGCTIKANIGVSSEEISKYSDDKNSLLMQNNVKISRELRDTLNQGLEKSLASLSTSDGDSSELDDDGNPIGAKIEMSDLKEKSMCHDQELGLPTLKAHRCGASSCAKPGSMQCGQCRAQYYCSQQCQRAHWPTHKLECTKSTL